MPFESLPGKSLNIPIQHFDPVPAKPVIPTAAYAAQLAKALGEILKNLSPAERKKKEAELSILNARVRQAGILTELQSLNLAKAKKGFADTNGFNSHLKSIVNGSPGLTDDQSPTTFEPPPQDEGDTTPVDYSGYDLTDGGYEQP